MNIRLNKEDLDLLKKIIDTKETNIAVADMLLYAFNAPKLINKKELERLQDEEGYLEKDAYLNLFLDAFEIDRDSEENIDIIETYFSNFKCLDEKEYLSNPYIKSFKGKTFKNKDYSLEYCEYKPYQLLPLDEILIKDKDYKEISQVGYFKNTFRYLALRENDVVWMCITPNEINTMKEAVKSVEGNVLVLGLGLGYFPYMASLKDNVNSITIIENNQNIIDIYRSEIEHFVGNSKIKIIKDNAFNYLKNNNNFDCVFADLWHNPEDGVHSFIKLKEVENDLKKPFYYWLEPSLIQMLRRSVITLFQEHFEGYTQDNYLFAENDFDRLLNLLYSKLRNIEFKSISDVNKILEKEELLKLISK